MLLQMSTYETLDEMCACAYYVGQLQQVCIASADGNLLVEQPGNSAHPLCISYILSQPRLPWAYTCIEGNFGQPCRQCRWVTLDTIHASPDSLALAQKNHCQMC